MDNFKESPKKTQLSSCHFCSKQGDRAEMLQLHDNQVCAECVLERLNPSAEIVQTLVQGFHFKVKSNGEKLSQHNTTFSAPQHFKDSSGLQVEIRCVQLNQEGLGEMTFPQCFQLILNDEVIHVQKSLQNKSAQKKRKDCSVFFGSQKLRIGGKYPDVLTIKEIPPMPQHRSDIPGTQYVFGLYLVRKLRPQALIEKIKTECMTVEQSKEQIRDKFISQHVTISKLKLPLECQLDKGLILTPARGYFCEHLQCFCLEHFIYCNHNAEHQRWRCLICKKPIIQFVVDKYQEQIIKQSGGKLEVYLEADGTYRFDDVDAEKVQVQEPQQAKVEINQAGAFATIVIDDSDNERKITEPPVVKKIKISQPVNQQAPGASENQPIELD